MSGFTIDIKGLQKAVDGLKAKAMSKIDDVDDALAAGSQQIAFNAKRRVTKDRGGLGRSITPKSNGYLDHEVVVQMFYAPFVEFGTKTYMQVPPGLEQYAQQFRGQKGKGNFKDLVKAIYEWMKRNSITANDADKSTYKSGKRKGQSYVKKDDQRIADLAYAYNIARKIVTKGLKPKPFLFPAVREEKPKIIREIVKKIRN